MKYTWLVFFVSTMHLCGYLTDADVALQIPGEPVQEVLLSEWDLHKESAYARRGYPHTQHYHAQRDKKHKHPH